VGEITFWQGAGKLIGTVPNEAAQLPCDAATAVAGISHIVFRNGYTLTPPWMYRATWSDQDGDHEVSTLTQADLVLVQTAIGLRRVHPEAIFVRDTRNLLIAHGHFPGRSPYHAPMRA
jgi:hypothetical protein